MDSTRLTDGQLDEAIDRAARAMTDRDADASFRARVAGRLSAADRNRFPVRRLAWAGALAVLVVSVGLGVMFLRGSWPSQQVEQATTTARSPSQKAAPSARDAAIRSATHITGGGEAPGAPNTTASQNIAQMDTRVEAGAPPAEDRGPAPLAHPSPIDLGSIAPKAIDITDIDVAPLPEIAPLTVPPTTLGSGEPPRRELK